MMNELRAIVRTFDELIQRGERCALATVVSVDGSSYRRPGARMLISASGVTTGSISAGCLETDVVEHGKRVIEASESKLVEYNTSSTDDELAWGLGLGCSGIVRVLIEPLSGDSPYVDALRRPCMLAEGGSISVATVYEASEDISHEQRTAVGQRLVVNEGGDVVHDRLDPQLTAEVRNQLNALQVSGTLTAVGSVEIDGTTVRLFLERLLPPVRLLIFGAGPDVLPMVEMARQIGWSTEVVDPQARAASRVRFPMADKVTLARPEELSSRVTITESTMTLVMTHSYVDDLALLGFLLSSDACYVGVVGARQRTERMLRDLAAVEGRTEYCEADLSRLHAPAGLDIGAEGPMEIALSITAEIRAVLDQRCGGMLRERRGSIHAQAPVSEARGSVAREWQVNATTCSQGDSWASVR